MSFSSRDTNIFPIVGIGTTVGTNILPDLQTWSSSVLEGGFPVFSFHPFDAFLPIFMVIADIITKILVTFSNHPSKYPIYLICI